MVGKLIIVLAIAVFLVFIYCLMAVAADDDERR